MNQHQTFHSAQSGAALVVSLIILLIMTMIGIQGLQSTTLEEKMAGNFRDRAIAFQAAEAGLKAAENYLDGRSGEGRPIPAEEDEVWVLGTLGDLSSPTTWNDATPGDHGVSDAEWHAPPRYFIEERGLISESDTEGKDAETGTRVVSSDSSVEVWRYRITAIGYGSSPNSQVVLQANYEKAY